MRSFHILIFTLENTLLHPRSCLQHTSALELKYEHELKHVQSAIHTETAVLDWGEVKVKNIRLTLIY